ncbi:MAG: hypothetical protein BMS9Abin36_0466 [Gammaproteobacteria bacterium]|nr:MAG: hypothetical protein BMS9Abin36_0466 [Gammaproteobacteria bacterium]
MGKKRGIFRTLRQLALLALFLLVAWATYQQQHASHDWRKPLIVTLYPLNSDGSDEVDRFIKTLSSSHFAPITRFLRKEATAYDVKPLPDIRLTLGPAIHSLPPTPPADKSDRWNIGLWSLKLRLWLYNNTGSWGLDARHVRLFVVFHPRNRSGKSLAHSFGLQKGLLGVVHAYALRGQIQQNNIIITHELLHTLGATDKYSDEGQPVFPEGFADGSQSPRYPQTHAEIMAGRIPLSPVSAEIPRSLDENVVGEKTAAEIHWY